MKKKIKYTDEPLGKRPVVKDFLRPANRADLFEKLSVAQTQSASGQKGITHAEMMHRLKKIGSRK